MAINFIYPVIMAMVSFGYLFDVGGSALISKTLGEGRKDDANK